LCTIRGTKRLKVEGFIYNVKGHQGHKMYVRDTASTRVKSVFIFYVFELGVVRKHGGKNIEDVGKDQMFFESNKRHQKRLHEGHKHKCFNRSKLNIIF
jgi:hypothetical protein